jgi:hypothetical protein
MNCECSHKKELHAVGRWDCGAVGCDCGTYLIAKMQPEDFAERVLFPATNASDLVASVEERFPTGSQSGLQYEVALHEGSRFHVTIQAAP